MKNRICLYAFALLIAGCSTSQPDEIDETEVKQAGNPAKCSQAGKKIYCDWDHVTDDWKNVSTTDLLGVSK